MEDRRSSQIEETSFCRGEWREREGGAKKKKREDSCIKLSVG